MRKWFVCILALIVILSGFPSLIDVPTALADSNGQYSETKSASSEATASSDEIVPGEVLVKYKSARVSSKGISAQSVTPVIQKISFSASTSLADKIRELKADPNVELVEPVYRVYASKLVPAQSVVKAVYNNQSDKIYMRNWGKTVTQLTYAAEFTDPQKLGQVTVAILDSGVDTSHPDLAASMVTGYDFVDKDANPNDQYGHGTGVAGIIAAQAHNADGYTGVAPGVKIMPIRVLNHEGKGTTADLIAGIKFAIDKRVNVINMSLGLSEKSLILQNIIRQAVEANILVVAAAGNDSNNWIGNEPGQLDGVPQADQIRYAEAMPSYPATFDEVVSVGAIAQLQDMSLTIADFSNTYKVDIAAPGVNIYTTILSHSHSYLSGTSAAAPFVTAMAALVIANDPTIKVSHLRALLENSASPLDPLELSYSNVDRNNNHTLTNIDFYGHGIVNGLTPFTQTRLELTLDYSLASTHNTVTATLNEKDAFGQPTSGRHTYKLYDHRVVENTPYRYAWEPDDTGLNGTVIESVYGSGTVTVQLPASMNDSFGYRFYLDDADSEEQAVESNWVYWYKRPAAPQPDKSAGSYSGSVTVQLSSSTPNSSLYYSLYNSTSDGIAVYPYTAPLILDKNSVLFTYALSQWHLQ
ncbi:MAG: serine protease [Paenibacillus sp.]|nr:serine protease [Paenibacillus sp.]